MFQGRTAWWPELWATAQIDSAAFQGYFHVAVSTRQVFLGTLHAALAFLVLGLAAYYCFRRLPLAALDRALQRLEAKQRELLEQKDQLEMQNLRFDAALSNMSQALCMFDGKQELVVCNASYAKMYGLPDKLTKPGTPFRAIMEQRIANGLHVGKTSEEYTRDLLESMVDDRPITKVVELHDGRVIAIKQRRMPDGGWISTHEDITQYRRIEAQVAHLARHDALTDLPNRLHLRERLEEATGKRAQGRECGRAMPRSRSLQGGQRHARAHVGDALLKAVAERLRGCLRRDDPSRAWAATSSPSCRSATSSPSRATALARPPDRGDERNPSISTDSQVDVGASVGIAVSPDDGNDADELLKNADLALYRAKAEGRSTYRFFEAGMDADMQARCKLQFDLRKALVERRIRTLLSAGGQSGAQ